MSNGGQTPRGVPNRWRAQTHNGRFEQLDPPRTECSIPKSREGARGVTKGVTPQAAGDDGCGRRWQRYSLFASRWMDYVM